MSSFQRLSASSASKLSRVSYHVTKFCHQASRGRVHVQHLTLILVEVKVTEPTTTSDQKASMSKNVSVIYKNLSVYISDFQCFGTLNLPFKCLGFFNIPYFKERKYIDIRKQRLKCFLLKNKLNQ